MSFQAYLAPEDSQEAIEATYHTLAEAVQDQTESGWEEGPRRLLGTPVIIREKGTGTVVAVITYQDRPDDPDHPHLLLLWTDTGKLDRYEYLPTADGYRPLFAASAALPPNPEPQTWAPTPC